MPLGSRVWRPLSIRLASLALRNASRDECMSSSGISSMPLGEWLSERKWSETASGPDPPLGTRRIHKPLACRSWFTNSSRVLPTSRVVYQLLYNNQINARALIGQSAVVYCAGELMEKSRVFWLLYKSNRPQFSMVYLSNRPQVSMVYKLINQAGCW